MSHRAGPGLLIALLLFGFEAFAAPPRYFMAVFAFQDWLNLPQNAHSFAVFVELPDGPEGTGAFPKERTISWLPKTLQVIVTGGPEEGWNVPLRTSIELGRKASREVTEWGPFEIEEGFFRRAVAQADRLERGELSYLVLDGKYRPDVGTNCIHALTDLNLEKGLLDTGMARGRAASRMITEHLSRWMINPQQTYPSVDHRLGIDQYGIVHELL